jgi:hypothetical protein
MLIGGPSRFIGATETDDHATVIGFEGVKFGIACEHLESSLGFLPVPSAALDPNGFMLEEGWHQDPTHANFWYGRHVLAQIEQIASTGKLSP